MTIGDNINTFAGRSVEEYDPKQGIQDPSCAQRLSWDYDNEDLSLDDILASFFDDPKSGSVEALIFGTWEESYDDSPQSVVDSLITNAQKLPKLSALFVGEMTFEECEISWIQQADYSRLWGVFPQLKYFQVRGGECLKLGKITQDSLEALVVETGGLPEEVLKDISGSQYPNLVKLELWLGVEDYGWSSNVTDLSPLLESARLPKLKSLGLCNSEYQDEVTELILKSEILPQLEELDLSKGIMTDKGGQALLDSEAIKDLKRLNLAHHYMSNGMMAKLKALDIDVNVDEQQKDDGEYRYVAVSE